jgi:virulence factor Mce-like protein
MSRRSAKETLVASPVLIGAVTVLITVVAVFIAYNANAGLPFVPTYNVTAQFPTGNKLVPGNDVRIGGFRVGSVDAITPKVIATKQGDKAIAQVEMKIQKKVQPLPVDSTLKIRPRSALGLKYVEITPGKSKKSYEQGSTISIKHSTEGLELEDVYSTLDDKTRENSRGALAGYGDAFAGRGESLNTSIQSLSPFFSYLTLVTGTLNDPDTQLKDFFPQLGETVAQLAPVAKINADLFANMATTFQALSADPRALQETIEKSPATLDTAVRSFRVQQPFLADATDLSRRLRPAVQQLPRSLPLINSAFKVGTPVLPRTVALNKRLNGTFSALDHLFSNPNTLLAFHDLRTTLTVTKPALQFVAPYQTVCNYWNYFVFPLGEHQSQVSSLGGTVQNQGVRFPNMLQANSLGNFQASRPVDTLPGVDPTNQNADPTTQVDRLYAQPQQPAIDAQGNADCQIGQNGYVRGPLGPDRYKPGTAPNGDASGGNSAVSISNFPILSGGTYVSRKLGINNLKDVEKLNK